MSIINREAVLAGLSGPSVEDTFAVTYQLHLDLLELSRALEEMAEGTTDPDLAARQRAVAAAFDYGCESFGGHAPRYRVTYPGGHQVVVRVPGDRGDGRGEDPVRDKADAITAGKAKVAKQAERSRSLLGRLAGRSPADLPVGVEPESAVRIG